MRCPADIGRRLGALTAGSFREGERSVHADPRRGVPSVLGRHRKVAGAPPGILEGQVGLDRSSARIDAGQHSIGPAHPGVALVGHGPRWWADGRKARGRRRRGHGLDDTPGVTDELGDGEAAADQDGHGETDPGPGGVPAATPAPSPADQGLDVEPGHAPRLGLLAERGAQLFVEGHGSPTASPVATAVRALRRAAIAAED